jgi:iron complex transport system permease protein
VRRRLSTWWFLIVGIPVTVVMALLSLTDGHAELTIAQIVQALAAELGWAESLESNLQAIVVELRTPRILIAVVAGSALAIAGTVMQAVFRNSLASPEILGTAQGAALGATVAIALGWAASSSFAVPGCAVVGAIVVTAVVYFIAGGTRGFSVSSLLLAGIAMNTLVGALIAFSISKLSGDQWDQGSQILYWLMGNFEKTTGSDVTAVALGLLVFGTLLVPFLRDLDVMTLHDEGASALGVNVLLVRSILLLVACGLTAVTVAFVGGIAFVGLVVPHMARLVVGPAHRGLVPCAAVLGAFLLVGSDYICRVLLPGTGLRVGVVMSLIGAPFFLYLLLRMRRGQQI